MEANEAPEEIWVHELSAMELNVPLKEYHIGYVRADAFIEKACEWIKYNNENGGCLFDGWEVDFKKYMEG